MRGLMQLLMGISKIWVTGYIISGMYTLKIIDNSEQKHTGVQQTAFVATSNAVLRRKVAFSFIIVTAVLRN